MPAISALDDAHLEAVSKVLGDTDSGLTGAEIGSLLPIAGIRDIEPAFTKWKRVKAALTYAQDQDKNGNRILKFIEAALAPARYVGNRDLFESRRDQLNFALSLCGYTLGPDGKLSTVTKARTLTEAEQRAGRLKAELYKRTIHPDVLKFCRAELLQDNYFHAVLEATKSVAEKLRQRSGLTGDGGQLAQEALGLGKVGMPYLAFNTLRSKTELDEQAGLTNLMVGMFGAFRNITGHAPRVSWLIQEQDAVDLLTLASFLHRRLDNAVRTPRT